MLCVQARIKTSTLLGDDSSKSLADDPATSTSITKDGQTGQKRYDDPVLVATSVHKNFIENAPLAILFAALVELNGGDRRALAGILGLFTVARVSHMVGVQGGMPMLKLRQFGFFASMGSILGLSSWGAFLVKGYWGL